MTTLRPLAALDTAPLFLPLHAALIALLRSLEPADWERQTVAGAWRVRDVAAHLLDGTLRRLAAHRDRHLLAPDAPIESYEDVLALINRLNAGGVAFGARLSPRLLAELLDVAGRWLADFFSALDPDATAIFPVSWAGETRSDNRFDVARDYTEHWHHQMQIRSAVGARGTPEALLARTYLEPLLETAVRALPHAYRDVAAHEGATVVLRAAGESSVNRDAEPLAWTLRREGDRWRLYRGEAERPTARAEAPPDALWRLLFNALPAERARDVVSASGPEELLAPLWRARAVMV